MSGPIAGALGGAMVNHVLAAIVGVINFAVDISASLLDLVLEPLLSQLGVPTSLPTQVSSALRSVGVLVDTIVPISTFVTGLKMMFAAWEFWMVTRSFSLVLKIATFVIQCALSTGGVVVDTVSAGVTAAVGALLGL